VDYYCISTGCLRPGKTACPDVPSALSVSGELSDMVEWEEPVHPMPNVFLPPVFLLSHNTDADVHRVMPFVPFNPSQLPKQPRRWLGLKNENVLFHPAQKSLRHWTLKAEYRGVVNHVAETLRHSGMRCSGIRMIHVRSSRRGLRIAIDYLASFRISRSQAWMVFGAS
jgi:hypothetical protein